MSERLSGATRPGENPTATSAEVHPQKSRTLPTFIEIEAIMQRLKGKTGEAPQEEEGEVMAMTVEMKDGEVVALDEVLVYWKHHTTRMRPVHANSHRMTF